MFVTGQFAAYPCFDLQFLVEFPNQGLLWRFALFYFPARKLPLVGMPVIPAPLSNEDLSVAVYDPCRNEQRWAISHCRGLLGSALRGD